MPQQSGSYPVLKCRKITVGFVSGLAASLLREVQKCLVLGSCSSAAQLSTAGPAAVPRHLIIPVSGSVGMSARLQGTLRPDKGC